MRACEPSCEADGLLEKAQTTARPADGVLDLIITHGDAEQIATVLNLLVKWVLLKVTGLPSKIRYNITNSTIFF